MKNKRGWMRVLEVFIALLMITSVSLIAINRGYESKVDVSSNVIEAENLILREIQFNEGFRETILGFGAEILPVGWEDENFPAELKTYIEGETPDYLECEAKICDAGAVCLMDSPSEKDIYIQSVIITANSETFNPNILELGCWRK